MSSDTARTSFAARSCSPARGKSGGDFHDETIAGIERFFTKTWKTVTTPPVDAQEATDQLVERTIIAVSVAIEQFSFNVGLARLMELAEARRPRPGPSASWYSCWPRSPPIWRRSSGPASASPSASIPAAGRRPTPPSFATNQSRSRYRSTGECGLASKWRPRTMRPTSWRRPGDASRASYPPGRSMCQDAWSTSSPEADRSRSPPGGAGGEPPDSTQTCAGGVGRARPRRSARCQVKANSTRSSSFGRASSVRPSTRGATCWSRNT